MLLTLVRIPHDPIRRKTDVLLRLVSSGTWAKPLRLSGTWTKSLRLLGRGRSLYVLNSVKERGSHGALRSELSTILRLRCRLSQEARRDNRDEGDASSGKFHLGYGDQRHRAHRTHCG
jgi:hypothetical protein